MLSNLVCAAVYTYPKITSVHCKRTGAATLEFSVWFFILLRGFEKVTALPQPQVFHQAKRCESLLPVPNSHFHNSITVIQALCLFLTWNIVWWWRACLLPRTGSLSFLGQISWTVKWGLQRDPPHKVVMRVQREDAKRVFSTVCGTAILN